MARTIRFFFLALFLPAAWLSGAPPDGSGLFENNCALCHKAGADNRTPLPEVLKRLPNRAIVTALESGSMKVQGSKLSIAERQAIADCLSPPTESTIQPLKLNACPGPPPALANLNGWNGWSTDLINSRMQTAKEAGISASDVPKLKVKWAFGFADAATVYSQPTVVNGRLFFGSGNGTVYSLDAKTGCLYWTFKSQSQVRTAVTIAAIGKNQHAAFFGDGQATMYALNAQTGELLWKTKLDEHKMAGITGAPKVYNGRVYVGVRSGGEEMMAANAKYACCTFRGSLASLDAATGRLIWKTYTIPDPPTTTKKNVQGTDLYGPSGAAIWSSPTIDVKRKAVYAGTGNNYSDPPTRDSDAVLAFDLDTGSSPILRSLPDGKDVLLIGQKSGMVYGIDPDKRGEILWEVQIGKGGALGGVMWGMAADNTNVYVPLSDIFPGPAGGLFALKISSGEKVWTVPPPVPACKGKGGCSAAQMAPATLLPGVVFSGSLDGHLRAYSTADGKVIWDLDTLRDYETVNGVKAHGGSMNATGPTIADGMMFVNSGYSQLTGMAGNVLLALTVDGK